MTTTATRPALTARQQAVLDWIGGFIDVHGYSPTVRQVAHAFSWASPNAASVHLGPLRRKGYVTWLDHQPRTLRVVEAAK